MCAAGTRGGSTDLRKWYRFLSKMVPYPITRIGAYHDRIKAYHRRYAYRSVSCAPHVSRTYLRCIRNVSEPDTCRYVIRVRYMHDKRIVSVSDVSHDVSKNDTCIVFTCVSSAYRVRIKCVSSAIRDTSTIRKRYSKIRVLIGIGPIFDRKRYCTPSKTLPQAL